MTATSSPESGVLLKHFEQACVRGRKVELRHFLPADPAEIGASQLLRLVLQPCAEEELQMHGLLRILMSDRFHLLLDLNFDAQFFFEFTAQTCLETLAGLPFAAGKLPQPAEMAFCGPLGNKQLALAKYEGRCDVNHLHGHGNDLTHLTYLITAT